MAPVQPPGRPGVVLVAHGSARSGASAEPVLALAAELRRRGFPEVRAAFWKEEIFLHQALETTRSPLIVVLPVFLAEGYFSRTVVPRELDLDYGWNRVGARPVRLLAPLGTSGAMAELVASRARESAPPGTPLDRTALVVMGHGTQRDAASADAVLDVCARLETTGEFARVTPAFIDQPPYVEDVLAAAQDDVVLLVPFLVAAGWHGGTTVPDELGLGRADGAAASRIVYTEPVGTHPRLVDAIEADLVAELEDAIVRAAAYDVPLARLEPVLEERMRRKLPLCILEVQIRAAPEGWELRHVIDADVSAGQLNELPDRDALERCARKTAGGQHRPLRTAANLPPGWRVPAPTVRDVAEALVTIYGPALVHWYLAERGALEPASFRETAARQTGIYAPLATVDASAIEGGIRHTCDGLPCLRRRLWTADGVLPATAPPSAGDELVVPCPAPCPVLLTTVVELLGAAEPESQ